MDETTENFLKVMREFSWPDPPKILYRVYYDDAGHPITYSMTELSGNYIDISREDYLLASMDSRVINGKLIPPVKNREIKLYPDTVGIPCHPDDVCVIVTNDKPNKKWRVGNGSG